MSNESKDLHKLIEEDGSGGMLNLLEDMDYEIDKLEKEKETLEELAKKYRLFIVSNSQKGYPEVMMEKLSITHLFAGHLCYGDTGTDKGTTIKILMEKHGIKDALYIGDTQGDYEATAASGIPFIWAAYGFGIPDGYAAKVDAFDELLEIL